MSKESIKSNMNQSVKDIISGFVSGWTQVLIMQPFEIVKIRLQTQSTANPYYLGVVDAFKKILKDEGMLSFYKGKRLISQVLSLHWLVLGFRLQLCFSPMSFRKDCSAPSKQILKIVYQSNSLLCLVYWPQYQQVLLQ